MPTPDQCNGSSLNPTRHIDENKKEMKGNQTESDRRFAVIHTVSYSYSVKFVNRNKIIQDLLERKQKELSGPLLASYFYNCKYNCVLYTATVTATLCGLYRVIIL